MIVNVAFALSLLSATYAFTIGRREDAPTDADLFASCPGGPGSKNVEKADKCTLVSILSYESLILIRNSYVAPVSS